MKKEYQIDYYGMIAEKMDKTSERLKLEIPLGENARVFFIQQYPILKNLPFQVAIDTKIIEEFNTIDFHKISLLPPFSGG